ncbi:NADH-ubiquinone oxidoreductase chain [Apis cerana cerana]|uniref:NADH-ubiquinone oxidoreductase chain n=1 Tax=Apis cerana cerana TaxID=94128 RepID=A0A2A3E1U6_APICC|nr:NADH-ubiquinone oxidoreductase chain [Apis cerana cerana]
MSTLELLICYVKIEAFTSGIVTIVVNRLGDIGLLLITFAKRAQISTWLPTAITAPTPIHLLEFNFKCFILSISRMTGLFAGIVLS